MARFFPEVMPYASAPAKHVARGAAVYLLATTRFLRPGRRTGKEDSRAEPDFMSEVEERK